MSSRLSSRIILFFLCWTFCLGGRGVAQAQLAPGGSVSGTLNVNNVEDTYSITFTQDGNVTFQITSAVGLRAILRFYDTDGASQRFAVGPGSFGETITLTVPHVGPGTYFIRAERFDGAGTYTLSNTFTPPALSNDTESNDTSATAKSTLAGNATRTGHLGYSRTSYPDIDIYDWYKVTVPSDGDLKFTLTPSATLRGILRFYDTDGASQRLAIGPSDFGKDLTLTVPHLAPGATYYVDVERYDGYGDYTIKSEHSPISLTNDTENNDTTGTAKATLAGSTTTTGHLGYSRSSYPDIDIYDWYKVTVPSDGDLKFTLTPSATLRGIIRFYDTDGASQRLAAGPSDFGKDLTLTVPHLAPGGTYYLLVERYDGYGSYTLKAVHSPVGLTNDAEPNNNTGQATVEVEVNKTLTGHLGYSRTSYPDIDNYDCYKVKVPADGDLTFIVNPNPTLRVVLRFYDTDGVSQRFAAGPSGFGTAINLTIPHLAPGGTYYLLVERYDGYGSYSLQNTWSPVSLANDAEINDTPGQTTIELEMDKTTTGHLGYSRASYPDIDNSDFYKVKVPADGDLTFIVNPNPTLRVVLRFYDTDGVSQRLAVGPSGFGDALSLTVPHLAPGVTYYFVVERYDGYGDYSLQTPWDPQLVQNDTESNDTLGTAKPYSPGTQVSGHLGYSRTSYPDIDLYDCFAITSWPGGNFTAYVQASGGLRTILRLYNSGGGQVTAAGPSSYGGVISFTVNNLAAGNYVLCVERYDGWGAYSLSTSPPITFSGTVDLLECVNKVQLINFEFRNTGGTVLFHRSAILNANGQFGLIAVPAGVYKVAVKGSKWLRKVINLDTTGGAVSGVTIPLKPGDANNDNSTDVFDLATLAESFNTGPDDSNWNAQCDFNCDNLVDIFDLATLAVYFNTQGDD